MSKFTRFGGDQTDLICGRGTKFDFKDCGALISSGQQLQWLVLSGTESEEGIYAF